MTTYGYDLVHANGQDYLVVVVQATITVETAEAIRECADAQGLGKNVIIAWKSEQHLYTFNSDSSHEAFFQNFDWASIEGKIDGTFTCNSIYQFRSPLSPTERKSVIYYMCLWRDQAIRWQVDFDTLRQQEGESSEALAILSNYFLTTAGCVYYHARDLEADMRGVNEATITRECFEKHPILKELKDRRDLVEHGVVSRAKKFLSMRRWLSEAVSKSDEVSDVGIGPRLRITAFDWVDIAGEPVKDVGEWQREVLPALGAMIENVIELDAQLTHTEGEEETKGSSEITST